MFGRSKRGCEGLFPVNYLEIKVPLREQPTAEPGTNPTNFVQKKSTDTVSPRNSTEEKRQCRVLFDFQAEADEDLEIRVSLI